MTIAGALAALKSALGPRSEREIISTLLADSFSPGHYRWLDVGIGDGISASRILATLAAQGITFSVTGLDPELSDGVKCPAATQLQTLKCSVEEFKPVESFDVINVRQSAHYFKNPIATLSTLTESINVGGRLIITHWTDDCFLFQLHRLIADALELSPSSTTLSELESGIKATLGDVGTQIILVEDTIDLAAILGTEALFDATLKIAARKLPLSRLSRASRSRLASRIAADWPKVGHRANGVMLVTPLTGRAN